MYRTNFYAHASVRPFFCSNHALDSNFLATIPQNYYPKMWPGTGTDHFSLPLAGFEKALHQKVEAITRFENMVKLKSVTIDQFDSQEKQKLIDAHESIQQQKKLLALIVENMQKCAANIYANFR